MTTILTKADFAFRRFPADRLDALFEAVLIDDEVDAHTELPDRITLDHDEQMLGDCFALCRQLWLEGADPWELRLLLDLLQRDLDLDAVDRRRFKHIRAKLKHFRFALALYGQRHTYPMVTHWMTTALGQVQDAFKLGQHRRIRRKARLAAGLLSPLPAAIMRREWDRLPLTSGAGFRRFLTADVRKLAAIRARPTLTGAEFHAARKVASRQVSFYDSLRTIHPSDESYRMSRTLAAINGLMGSMHDRLVERHADGSQDYHRERFALPAPIADRIDLLIDRYRSSGLAIG